MIESCICCSCGKKVELSRGELPCDVLHDWFMLSQLKGHEAVDRYCFCSLGCLKKWADKQLPEVPDVFLESLDEEDKD